MQRPAQRVDFDHDLAERIARIGVAAAQRIVAFAQRFEHVRERLQRAHDALPHDQRSNEHGQRDRGEYSPAQWLGGIPLIQRDARRDPRGNGA